MKQRNRGLTLAEILISTALMFVIIAAMIVLQDMADKFFKSATEKGSLQTNINYTMGRIVRGIRGSQSAEILDGGSGLRLRDQYNNVIEFRWEREGKVLYYSDTANSISGEILGQGVSSLRFSPEGRSIFVELRIEAKGRNMELSSRATLRNP